MKLKFLYGISFAVVLLGACKKGTSDMEQAIKTDPLELLSDSISYTIDGVTAIQTRVEGASSSIINTPANVKLDSLIKQKEYTSGDRDSVMFGRGFKFSDNKGQGIDVAFIKKYNKSEAQAASRQTSLFIPLNTLDLFSVGKRNFALDYTRNNSQNGIVLELKGTYYGLQTYGYSSFVNHQLLSQDLQSGSKFEITNLQKLKSGKYILEAKFNASVYYGDGTHAKKVENGYLRLKLNPEDIYF